MNTDKYASKYSKIEWVDGATPINADNLNKMDNGIQENASNIASLATETADTCNTKVDKTVGLVIDNTGKLAIKEDIVILDCNP